MCIETTPVFQLIASVTVLLVGLYVYENERIVLKFQEHLERSLNDIESRCSCNPEGKQNDALQRMAAEVSDVQKLRTELSNLQKNYETIDIDLANTSLLIKEQWKLIKELQRNHSSIISDVKDNDEWITKQKLISFFGESGRDLVIIIDSSGSIDESEFKQSLENIATMVGLLCPKPDPFDSTNQHHNQIAVIVFSNEAKEIFDFKKYHRLTDIQKAIKSINYDSGATCTEKAFSMAINMFTEEKGMRSSSKIKKEVLFLTDGIDNCAQEEEVISTANSLKSVANVYGLFIGARTDGQSKLAKLVSGSDKSSLFTVGNYTRFSQLVSKLKQDIDNGVLQCAK